VATTVSVREAKTHLSRLLARVEAGEEIVIARRGRPIARLQRLNPAVLQRRPGNDRVIIHPDFDDPIPEWDPDYMHPGDPMREDVR
jgi:prevent-host-death family protein